MGKEQGKNLHEVDHLPAAVPFYGEERQATTRGQNLQTGYKAAFLLFHAICWHVKKWRCAAKDEQKVSPHYLI